MNKLLLSEKWRPKTIKDIVLLPRISKIFKNGITQNYLLYGSFGTGKTTLSRILVGKYTKDKPSLEINGSIDTSIEILRGRISDFCSTVYMGLDLDSKISKDDIKYVIIDECERISLNFQDALKAYVEEFSSRNVRFIFITNHIDKISKGLLSRLQQVNFDCQSPEEEKYIKNALYKKIFNIIAPAEGFEIKKEDLIKIINKKFPDMRSILIDIDNFRHTGETSLISNVNNKLK